MARRGWTRVEGSASDDKDEHKYKYPQMLREIHHCRTFFCWPTGLSMLQN
jgi:hypothetical protein